jgi:N-acetylneuraminic acid mutarotase
MAWLSGYSNRIKIPINASSDGALSNFQVRLNIVASTGTNVAGTIYLQNLSLEWPYDIRFTSSDGSTLIDYWRLESDATDGTWIVEVPSIAAEGTTDIYLYYGKADDTDASNIYNTCITPSDDFRYSNWTTKGNMPWTVADHTAEVYNGKFYVIGGYNSGSSDELTTIQEYNPADDSWTAKTAMPTGRWGLIAVQVDGNIYVFGGDKDGVGQAKLEIYSISGNSWSTGTAPPAAIGYQGITGCSDGTDIYLQYKQYLYKYDVSEGTYTQLNAAVPGSRTWVVMSYYNGNLYLLTGYKYADGSGACPTVSIYNIAENSWSTGTNCPYNVFGAARENVISGDKIYIVHGQGTAGYFYSFVLVYDISDNSWTEMSPGPYSDDGCAGSFYNGKYYVFGGRKDITGPYGTNGVSVYDPTNDVAQSRWDWLNCGLHECPDDMFRTKSLSSWSHVGARSKNTVDTDNTWIEFDFTPVAEASTSSQNIEFLYANDDISTIYWYVYRNISDKIIVYTRQSSTSANRWTSTESYTVGTTYHAKIKDTGTAITLYLQSSSGVDIENSGSINYDTTTQKIQLRAGNTNDEVKYKNLIIRKYTANEPEWATPLDVENYKITGSSSVNISDVVCESTGTGDDEKTYDCTLSATLDDINVSITGVLEIEGITSSTIDNVVIVSSGTSLIQGSASINIENFGITSVGTLPIDGVLSKSLDDIIIYSIGSCGIVGESSIEITDFSIESVGTVPIVGIGNINVDAISCVSNGTLYIDGDASIGIENILCDSSGAISIIGAVSVILDDIVVVSAGGSGVLGASNITLNAFTIGSTGVINIIGEASVSLSNVGINSAGTVDIVGTGIVVVDSITIDSNGHALIECTLDAILSDIGISSTIGSGISGNSNVLLNDLVLGGTGTALTHGLLSDILDDITVVSNGVITVSGTVNIELDDISVVASEAASAEGSAILTLDDFEIGSAARIAIAGALDVTIANLMIISGARALTRGSVYRVSDVDKVIIRQSGCA